MDPMGFFDWDEKTTRVLIGDSFRKPMKILDPGRQWNQSRSLWDVFQDFERCGPVGDVGRIIPKDPYP